MRIVKNQMRELEGRMSARLNGLQGAYCRCGDKGTAEVLEELIDGMDRDLIQLRSVIDTYVENYFNQRNMPEYMPDAASDK